MSAECAVCYVSDLNFLLPSLVSASGVRKFVPPHKADIYIFTVGVDGAQVEDADRFMQGSSIRVVPMDSQISNSIDRAKLSQTHTPLATFGRFFLDAMLPPSAKRIVYIDGDTWIERDPTSLIEAIVPEEFIAAAEDTISFRQNFGFGGATRLARHYFRQLGLDPKNGYFNAGVFAVSRNSWKTIEQEALSFFLGNLDICKHFDQSALNVVTAGRRLRLSNKWNFQTQLKFWGADRYIEPHIYHFNRNPKPWMGACDPWKEMYSRYEFAVSSFNSLGLPLRKLSPDEENHINAANHKTYSYLQWPLASKLALASMNFLNIERNSWLQ